MKKLSIILVLFCLAVSLAAVTNTWQGDESLSWRTAGNWSLNLVPTATHDVVIPAGTPNYCYVTQTGGYNAYCNSIVLQNGATLRVGNAVVQIDYDLTIYGHLYFSSDDAVVDVNDDIIWGSGSTENITRGEIWVKDDWTFEDGSNCTLGTGSTVIFDYATNSSINCSDSNGTFGNLFIDKPAGTGSILNLATASTYPIQVLGNLTVSDGNTFHINNEILEVVGTLDIEDGGKMDSGASGSMELDSDFDLYGELRCDGNVELYGDLSLYGNLVIEGGSALVHGNIEIIAGASLFVLTDADLEVNSDFVIYGGVSVYGDVLAHGDFELETTGTLIIDGNFICDDNSRVYQYLRGTLDFTGGLFELTNNSLNIASTCNIVSYFGTIRVGGAFNASYAGTFQPDWGSVVMIGSGGSGIQMHSDNYLKNLNIEDDTWASSDLIIYGDLKVNNGYFKPNGHLVQVGNFTRIYDELRITNSASIFRGGMVNFETGSTANITAGNIEIWRYLYFHENIDAQFGVGNTITFVYSYQNGELICLDDDVEIGNLVFNQTQTPERVARISPATTYPIHVIGDLDIINNNSLDINGTTLIVDGEINVEAGSTLLLEDVGGELINNSDFTLNGELDIDGGDVLVHGEFNLNNTGTLTIDGGSFVSDVSFGGTNTNLRGTFNLSDGTFEATNTNITFSSSCTDNITGGLIRVGANFYAIYSNTFQPSGGTTEFIGSIGTVSCSNGNYFYSLEGNHGLILNSDLTIQNDLDITSGYFELNNHEVTVNNNVEIYGGLRLNEDNDVLNVENDITFYSGSTTTYLTSGTINVLGDWYFNDGTNAQFDTGNTVNFVGTGSQSIYCYDADAEFGSVGIHQPGTSNNVYFNGSSTQPMQVAGDMDVNSGNTFHIQNEDLIVDGTLDINSGGTMNMMASGSLTNNSDFDLNGELDIDAGDALIHGEFELASTGTLTIDGGSFVSDAAYSRAYQYIRGDFNMSSGLFEITNNHLRFMTTCVDNISGGTIRVGGNFHAPYAGAFQPTGGEVEMIGSTGSEIQCYNGNYLHDLVIENDTWLMQDLVINNDLSINSGYFNLNGHTTDVVDRVYIYDNLRMVNASDVLNCDYIEWNSGSSDTVTTGTINVGSDWYFNDGTTAQLGTGNTVTFTNYGNYIYCYDADAEFGTVEIPDSGFPKYAFLMGGSTEPMRVSGDMTVSNGNTFHLQNEELIVDGTLDINSGGIMDIGSNGELELDSDFDLNGELDVGSGDVLAHGKFEIATTGNLTIDGGSFVNDVAWSQDIQILRGTFSLSSGLFEVTYTNVSIASSFIDNISGGTFRFGGTFHATSPGTFEPTGGEVEAEGGFYCRNGNYFYDLRSNGGSPFTDITINNDLYIESGPFVINNTIDVENDVHIYSGVHMNSSTDILEVGNDITWYSGSFGGIHDEISDGTINVSGDWYFNAGTNAQLEAGSTVNFVGTENSNIYCADDNACFGTLVIDKDSANNRVYIYDGDTVRIAGDLDISSGSLNLWDLCVLEIGSALNIYNLGELDTDANSDAPIITQYGINPYAFNVESGGIISSSNTIFEYMDTNGVNVKPGAVIDTNSLFLNCAFRNGESGGTLLTIDNNQTATLDGLSFYAGSRDASYNVTKNVEAGEVLFTNTGGTFGGPDYENDYYNRLNWSGFPSGNWTGLVSNDWHVPGNWEFDLVPAASTDVTIPSGTPFDPIVNSDEANCKDLTIESGASLQINAQILNVADNCKVYGELIMNDAGGVLNITNNVTWNSGSSADVSTGTINVEGGWTYAEAIQLGIGNTVNFIGSSESNIHSTQDAGFGNIVVNKSDDNNPARISDDTIVAGSINVNNGTLFLHSTPTLQVGNEMIVNSGARLLTSIMSSGNVTITKFGTGNYTLSIESGGILDATDTIFEYMDSDGVNVNPGAIIDDITDCTFSNGVSGGTLLTIDNDQTLTLDALSFYAGSRDATYNVTKNVDIGEVTFTNSGGSFDGPDHEIDPNNLLSWPEFYAPLVTTDTITNISETEATCGGNVTADFGSSVTTRGVCWSTSADPTIADDLTADGAGTGAFISSLTGLDPETHYYVRAYAANAVGTSYGDEVEFTSVATPLITVSVSSLPDFGDVPINTDSVEQSYTVSGSALTNDITINAPNGFGISLTSEERGNSNITQADIQNPSEHSKNTNYRDFSSQIVLSPTGGSISETTIYVRFSPTVADAYSSNITHESSGAVTKNVAVSGTGITIATVTTEVVTNITETTATGGGNVTANGGSSVTTRGVCWSTSANPTTADNLTTDGTGTGAFVSSLTGLAPGTHYFVRAYTTNFVGTSYGNEVEITTLNSVPSNPPANLIIEVSGTDVVLSWDAVPEADSYRIYSSLNPNDELDSWSFEEEVTVSTWSEAVPTEQKYYYVSSVKLPPVRSMDAVGLNTKK